MERMDIQNKIIAKAMSDESFKKALMSDPAAAIEKEFGVKVPADIKINVVEETSKEVYLVLPSSEEEGMMKAQIQWG